jgi:hypothetical protein
MAFGKQQTDLAKLRPQMLLLDIHEIFWPNTVVKSRSVDDFLAKWVFLNSYSYFLPRHISCTIGTLFRFSKFGFSKARKPVVLNYYRVPRDKKG